MMSLLARRYLTYFPPVELGNLLRLFRDCYTEAARMLGAARLPPSLQPLVISLAALFFRYCVRVPALLCCYVDVLRGVFVC